MRAILLLLLAATVGCAADGSASNGSAAGASTAGTGDVNLVEVETVDPLVDDLARTGAPTVVLNVWATWCPPCVAEFPMLVAYDAETDSVAVRFVSVDSARDRDAVVRFIANHDVTAPTYLYTGREDLPSQLNPLFQGGAIPVTMVFDGDGSLEYTHVGAISREELERIVADAVASRS